MLDDYRKHPQLAQIKIVLIETSHPGNIGAVARAMKNMGLSQLALVNPKQYPSVEASQRASSANDVLNGAEVFDALEAAVADCNVVVGASARLRKVKWPQLDVRQTAAKAMQVTVEAGDKIALVFGREDSGLSNDELDKCHYLAHIPTNPAYSSLNLAQAVQVFAYECLMASDIQTGEAAQGDQPKLASAEQLEGFYGHLYQALQDIEFLDPEKNARFMRRMRRLFNRTQMDPKEVDIMRGILTAAQRQSERLATYDREKSKNV